MSKQGDEEAASAIWKCERRLRITSSNVKAIAQQVSTVKQLLYSKFVGNAATRYKLFQVFRMAGKGEGLCRSKGKH